ncbi:hypothetical protein F5B20DRAFT_593363 [Whalleya microplaca]|nr:hypothetical protein F5B20DRAFT_593363 [Whalleya microplaca]
MPPFRNHPGPQPSRFLAKELEDELRVDVFDFDEPPSKFPFWRPKRSNQPDIIIGNVKSGCHGLYHVRRNGVEFTFHHARMAGATECKCLEPGTPDQATFQIPDYLNYHRLQLMYGRGPRMEHKLAAMVVMKLFLGLDVPAPLRFNPESVMKKTEEVNTDEANTDEANTDEANTDEANTDEANTDEANTDETKEAGKGKQNALE